MQLGNILGSRKARQITAAVVALGVIQVPLVSFADAPSPWVQKADQQKKKKKKAAARRAARRPVQQTKTVTRAPEIPTQTPAAPPAQAPAPVVAEAPPVPAAPPAAPPPAAPVPVPAAAAASGGGMGWLLPVIGLLGLGGLVAAMGGGSDSNG